MTRGRFSLFCYRLIWRIVALIVPAMLLWRSYKGKEDSTRLAERYGHSTIKRPSGKLYWLHGVSVGESVSSLVLAMAILKAQPDAHILITSATTTSQKMLRDRIDDLGLSNNIITQYHPHDAASWVHRFLSHWTPDVAVMMESDIWPNMITLSHKMGIPVMMASAQISDTSLKRWTGIARSLAPQIFSSLHKVVTIDEDQANRFSQLVDDNHIFVGGSMKAAAPQLNVDEHLVSEIAAGADGRTVVVLASSHEGEEQFFLEAMEAINQSSAFMGIIVPRHVQRGSAIMKMIHDTGMTAAQRSKGDMPDMHTKIWLADAMGEMGSMVSAADIIVLGGGFAPLGGHNPMEMAALGKGVISGPNVFKNVTIFNLLKEKKGCIFVDSPSALGDMITLLATSSTRRINLNKGAAMAYDKLANAATETAHHVISATSNTANTQAIQGDRS